MGARTRDETFFVRPLENTTTFKIVQHSAKLIPDRPACTISLLPHAGATMKMFSCLLLACLCLPAGILLAEEDLTCLKSEENSPGPFVSRYAQIKQAAHQRLAVAADCDRWPEDGGPDRYVTKATTRFLHRAVGRLSGTLAIERASSRDIAWQGLSHRES